TRSGSTRATPNDETALDAARDRAGMRLRQIQRHLQLQRRRPFGRPAVCARRTGVGVVTVRNIRGESRDGAGATSQIALPERVALPRWSWVRAEQRLPE